MREKIKFIILIIISIMWINVSAKEGWIKEGKNTYYYENNQMVQGFKNIDSKLYFFSNVNGALKYGWQGMNGNTWYQDKKTGEVLEPGWQVIEDNKYYFDEDRYLVNGFQEIDEKVYFFSNINGALKYGWQGMNGNTWYQDKKTGEVLEPGWQVVENNKYYFDADRYLVQGFQEIDGKVYFFSNINGALKYGWQGMNGNTWYQDKKTGEVLEPGWQVVENNKYYFDENRYLMKGFQEIDGKVYFFSNINGALKYGWQGMNGNTWYQDEETGEVYSENGWALIKGKTYYFENKYVYKGIQKVEEKEYYFDPKTGERLEKTKKSKYKEIIINPNTFEYIKIQYTPLYYNQKDKRWSNKKIGLSYFGTTGCAPTSMAMAFSSLLERDILPLEIANYLYTNTDQYNKIYKGTSGLGIIYAANHYQVSYVGIATKKQLVEELKKGRIVFAAMANGKFATKNWNHAIIAFNYRESDNSTYTHDPLNTNNNEWTNINIIFNEKSEDPDDLLGGYALYSLYK